MISVIAHRSTPRNRAHRFLAALTLIYAGCATTPKAPPALPAPPPSAATRPAAPLPPVDPAPLTDGDVTVAWMHGMQIVVKRIPGAEFVAGQLYVRGGVRNWGEENAGVERLALAVSASGGTQTHPKDDFNLRLSSLGSTLHALSGDDYSVWRAKSLLPQWDATFDLLADAFLHPALPPSEIALQRQRQIADLRHEQEDPDGRLGLLVHQTIFQGHPYAHRAIGTIETVGKLDAAALEAHLAMLRETSRLLLVVVGDVDAAHVLDQTRRAFASLPRGDYHETPLPPLHFDQARLVAVEKKLPTNYIESIFPGPAWTDPDFAAAMVGMSVLGWREFDEVRTRRNLSYAPHAGLTTSTTLPRGSLYVTAVDANATMKVMFDEARRLQREPVPAKELAGDKSVFLSGFLMSSEATDGQAALLGRAQIYAGDWRAARTLPERIRTVSAEAVQSFAQKYIGKLQTIVLGDPGKLDQALFNGL